MFKRIFESTLFRSSGIYTISSVLNNAIPFLMIPILTRYLSPVDYGIVAMFQVLFSFISPFVGLNAYGAIHQKYYNRETVDFPKYIGNGLLILIVSTCIVSGMVWLFAGPISTLSAFPANWLWSVIIFSVGYFLNLTVLLLWVGQKKPILFGVLQVVQTLINLSISIWLVVSLSMGWQGRILGQVIAVGGLGILSLFIMWKQWRFKLEFDRNYLRHILNFGVPLVPYYLGLTVMMLVDRFFITNMIGLAETGIYMLGYQFGQIIVLLYESFNKAYVPWLYERLKMKNEAMNLKIVKLTYLIFFGILIMASLLCFIVPLVFHLVVGKEFMGASVYVLWITFGYAFNSMYKVVANNIFYTEKTQVVAWITIITGVFHVGLNYSLINLLGAIGAAQACLLSFFICFIITWVWSNKLHPM
ncbi:MAG: hypothetical protein A3H98_01045, partial [Bacteroidetes bacterium RIFCSPLOWO2_02_FULL_36_8]